ncbi:MAG: hypothetical protein CMJ49_07475, partial [Planctomycetaceae bacterium]|nr:hypothetical protein [Planctomycetaceae bacterium]
PATQPPTTQPALVPIQPRSLSLTELEAKFHEVSALPIDQQPLNELTAAYTALKATKLHEADLAIVDVRLHILAARRELLESIRLIADARRQLQQQRDQAAAPPQVVAKPKAYTAVGLLFASTLYTGDVLPHLYRLVEPLSGLTIAYVEPSDAADLRPMLGRLVGVVGKARSDPALRLRVVAVETADVLSAQPIPATVGVSTDLPTD